MDTDATEIIQYPKEIDDEFNAFLDRMRSGDPLVVSGEQFDFSKISGNPARKVAKAIILYQTCEHMLPPPAIAAKLGISLQLYHMLLHEALEEGISDERKDILRELELQKTLMIDRWAKEEHDAAVAEGKPNPGFLRVLQENIKLRMKLNGLEEPRQVQVDKTERKISVHLVRVNTREEVEAARAAGLLK